MKGFRSIGVALVLAIGVASMPAFANYDSDDNGFDSDPTVSANAPKAWSMAADAVIARPLLAVATVAGAIGFVVTLPFTALGGNVAEAGQAMVVEPAKATFVRCLGCTNSGYSNKNFGDSDDQTVDASDNPSR